MARKILKRFFIFLLLLSFLFVGAFLYIKNLFLPVKAKALIIAHAQQFFQRKVHLGEVGLDPLKGLYLRDFNVQDKADPSRLFIHADEISVNLVLPSFFKKKSLLVPFMKITGLYMFARRDPQGSWNFDDLSPSKRSIKTSASPLRLLVHHIYVKDGQVDMESLENDALLREEIRQIHMDLKISPAGVFRFKGKATAPATNTLVICNGSYESKIQKFSGQIRLRNFYPATYALYISRHLPFRFATGKVEAADLELIHEKSYTQLNGRITASDVNMTVHDNKNFMASSFKAQELITIWDGKTLKLKGVFGASDFTASFPSVEKLRSEHIEARMVFLTFQDDALHTEGGATLQGASMDFGGHHLDMDGLNSNNIIFKRATDTWSLSGDYYSQNCSYQTPGSSLYKGTFNLSSLSMQYGGRRLAFNGTAVIPDFSMAIYKEFSLSGSTTLEKGSFEYSFVDRSFRGNVDINIDDMFCVHNPAVKVSGRLLAPSTHVSARNGVFSVSLSPVINPARVVLDKNGILTGLVDFDKLEITSDNGVVTVQSEMNVNDLTAKVNDTYEFRGNPKIQMITSFDPTKTVSLVYEGRAQFKEASLTGLPVIQTAQNITADLRLKNDVLSISSASFSALNSSFNMTGTVKNFTQSQIDLSAISEELDIASVLPLLPETLTAQMPFVPSGKIRVKTSISGNIAAMDKATVTAEADLLGITVKSPSLPAPASDINGIVRYAKDLVEWENLNGTIMGQTVRIDGRLNNFSRPTVLTSLKAGELDLKTDIKILRGAMQFAMLKGRYYHSTFDLQGDVHFPTQEEPKLNLRGKLDINLTDLKLIPQFTEDVQARIMDWDPAGILHIKGLFRGRPSKWRDWDLSFQGKAEEVRLKNIPFKDLTLNFMERDNHISQCDITAVVFGGQLKLTSSANILDPGIFTDATIQLDVLNIGEMRESLKMDNQYLDGKLSAHLEMHGPIREPEKIEGNGGFALTEGMIMRFRILDGLFKAMLIPEFHEIYFSDAQADFKIHNGKLLTDNVQLAGNVMNLHGVGWVDFQQNIYFDVIPSFNQATIMRSESFRKIPTALLSQVVKIRISGTLGKPVYKADSPAIKLIQGTTGMITDGIRNVLKDIF